jgi:hypothetical protein
MGELLQPRPEAHSGEYLVSALQARKEQAGEKARGERQRERKEGESEEACPPTF